MPSLHRFANAGFRCVRNVSLLPPEVLAERRQTIQDFTEHCENEPPKPTCDFSLQSRSAVAGSTVFMIESEEALP